ncbi:hypothetical protein A3C87_03390 [Candidatus Kaiserbacteria bacterium RIFCSPHIGHO2_02_FULL_49_34]|uniref:Uncharacterized protein n=1 Tax=Candidatus Kaiserbacteria bacterium RIFCSPHIGHO2_02_FULL_49_34 TaxID=1798491 RepID=A0A1F6DIC6_9BACT|nr:MAG: hypothetical protein A3C87_03390 [Candidatus Kaiserbacteria bacterium RIFCSPHIGHO2_02_FULL_49_34]
MQNTVIPLTGGDFEIGYEFEIDELGRPPGQVKAFMVCPFEKQRKRIAAQALPLPEREKFVQLTGCEPYKLGLDMSS